MDRRDPPWPRRRAGTLDAVPGWTTCSIHGWVVRRPRRGAAAVRDGRVADGDHRFVYGGPPRVPWRARLPGRPRGHARGRTTGGSAPARPRRLPRHLHRRRHPDRRGVPPHRAQPAVRGRAAARRRGDRPAAVPAALASVSRPDLDWRPRELEAQCSQRPTRRPSPASWSRCQRTPGTAPGACDAGPTDDGRTSRTPTATPTPRWPSARGCPRGAWPWCTCRGWGAGRRRQRRGGAGAGRRRPGRGGPRTSGRGGGRRGVRSPLRSRHA